MGFTWSWEYVFYFVVGGSVTLAVVLFEEYGSFTLSRLAALFPIVTWLSYLFIANSFGTAHQVASHAEFVLTGTIFSWIPYMGTIIYLSPKIGVTKAVMSAIGVFFITALIFTYVYYHI